ncbi:hypothetical protein BKA59DRAFT_26348 [Fusarium tricinctum]|uniref:Secreted protein n=1 Tax=Fusarium tricinctum TaxID=61284 RepID=A0A8K0SBT6_9HYPO|nr:hypothetical protein BKA59DRAFT_26348 [Fusarium tricinctum]
MLVSPFPRPFLFVLVLALLDRGRFVPAGHECRQTRYHKYEFQTLQWRRYVISWAYIWLWPEESCNAPHCGQTATQFPGIRYRQNLIFGGSLQKQGLDRFAPKAPSTIILDPRYACTLMQRGGVNTVTSLPR